MAADHDPVRTETDTVPVVVQLTDDNGDSVIDGRDSPDVVFELADPGNDWLYRRLVGVRGVDASVIFSVEGNFGILGGSGPGAGCLAAADVMGDGAAELFVGDENHLLIYDSAGTLVRTLNWVHHYLQPGNALAHRSQGTRRGQDRILSNRGSAA